MILKIDMEFEIDGKTEEEAFDNLSEQFAMSNETVENIFWGNLEVKK